MNYEKSCGAVVYYIHQEEILYLILKMGHGHFSLPKGHVENAETEEETALREIFEETQLEVNLNTDFREIITYSPKPDIEKDVVFFLAEAKSQRVIPQLEEVIDFVWLNYKEAKKRLTFQKDQSVLTKAHKYLNK